MSAPLDELLAHKLVALARREGGHELAGIPAPIIRAVVEETISLLAASLHVDADRVEEQLLGGEGWVACEACGLLAPYEQAEEWMKGEDGDLCLECYEAAQGEPAESK